VSRAIELIIDVVAGLLRDSGGRVLIAERLGGGHFQGLWEFPGGKIGADETPEIALERELFEEIGVRATRLAPYMRLTHTYPDRTVRLRFYSVIEWSGEAKGKEGQKICWADPGDIRSEHMLPADAPVLDALRQQTASKNVTS
jgi:8-oxo-dGTP diphosphatase